MPINHFDLQRLAGIRLNEEIKRKGSPDRFGKSSSKAKEDAGKTNPLLSKLLKQAGSEPKSDK